MSSRRTLIPEKYNKMKKSYIEPKFKYKDVNFAHESEREFAKILDFYDINWAYEPKTFPVEWDREGHPKISFTPDFFLPDYDLFIELTTLNQKLVTKKNRKLKRIKELYPEVNIKLFYKKDFQSLLFNKQINK